MKIIAALSLLLLAGCQTLTPGDALVGPAPAEDGGQPAASGLPEGFKKVPTTAVEETDILPDAMAGQNLYEKWRGQTPTAVLEEAKAEGSENATAAPTTAAKSVLSTSSKDVETASRKAVKPENIDDWMKEMSSPNITSLPDIECNAVIRTVLTLIVKNGGKPIVRRTPIGMVILSSDSNADFFATVLRTGVVSEIKLAGVGQTVCSNDGEYYEIVYSKP